MLSGNQTANEIQNITIGDILAFFRKYWNKIAVFAVISLSVVAVLLLALYFLLPKTDVFNLKISIQLPKHGNSLVYPNEMPYNANDIISIPVLRSVYNKNKLEKKIDFEDFSQLFYLSGNNMEQAVLAASFRNKLGDKKLSVIELRELEREYDQALQGIDSRFVEISMRNVMNFTALEKAKILNDVPQAWFDIYSVQEAKVMPQFHSEAQIKELRAFLPVDGWLITLDKIRKLCSDLQFGCNALNDLVVGQQIALPSGEYLKELQGRVNSLIRHRIGTIMHMVMATPSYHSQFDRIYLTSFIVALDRQINSEKAKYEATVDAINIIHPGNSDLKKSEASIDKNSSVTMNFDGTFFTSIAQLIRTASSIELREKYANAALEKKSKIAELEEEKNYYMMMLSQLNDVNNRRIVVSKEQLQRVETHMFEELMFLCKKLNEFKIMIMKDYKSNRKFFVSSGEVMRYSEYCISFTRLILGLFVLLFLINAIYVGKMFYKAYISGELKK